MNICFGVDESCTLYVLCLRSKVLRFSVALSVDNNFCHPEPSDGSGKDDARELYLF